MPHILLLDSQSVLSAEDSMNEFGASDVFIICIVSLIFIVGIYTLLKFRKNKNF